MEAIIPEYAGLAKRVCYILFSGSEFKKATAARIIAIAGTFDIPCSARYGDLR